MLRRLLPLAVLAVALPACGGEERRSGTDPSPSASTTATSRGGDVRIDLDSVGEQVQAAVRRATGGRTDVECKGPAKPVVRQLVTCDVAADGMRTIATVTVTGVDAKADPPFDLDIQVPIVQTAKIEADAPQQLRDQVGAFRIDCPTIVPVSDRLDFDCDVVEPAKFDRYAVHVTGSPDDVRYETVENP